MLTDLPDLTDDELIAAALDVANEIRAALNLTPADELANGTPGDYCRCPIARTVDSNAQIEVLNTGSSWSGHGYITARKLQDTTYFCRVESLPAYVFVHKFDSGNLPELIAS